MLDLFQYIYFSNRYRALCAADLCRAALSMDGCSFSCIVSADNASRPRMCCSSTHNSTAMASARPAARANVTAGESTTARAAEIVGETVNSCACRRRKSCRGSTWRPAMAQAPAGWRKLLRMTADTHQGGRSKAFHSAAARDCVAEKVSHSSVGNTTCHHGVVVWEEDDSSCIKLGGESTA